MAAKKPTEAQVRKQAESQGFTLAKVGRRYKLVAENGTLVADDWGTGDGLPLDAIAEALGSE